MITTTYFHQGPDQTDPSRRKRAVAALMRSVAASLEHEGGGIRSASGFTAALAINYCEVKGYAYTVHAIPRAGYSVKRTHEEEPSETRGQDRLEGRQS